MNWLAAWLLHPAMAFGAAAVASPILIHLLSRRRFRRVLWPAMDFLLEAHRQNRRRARIEQLILLALRCLAVLLLVLVLARPFVRPGLVAALLGAAVRTERIVLLDDSYSMAYRDGGQRVFDRARQAVERLIRWLSAESPGDAFALVLTSRPGQPVISVASLLPDTLVECVRNLGELRTTELPARPDAALTTLAAALAERPQQTNTALYIVSDFQRVDWAPAAEVPGADIATAAGSALLGKFQDSGQALRLILMDVAADRPENVAIAALQTASPQVVAGVPLHFMVELANYSDRVVSDLELSITSSGQAFPPALVPSIPPGERKRLMVEITLPRAGWDYVRFEAVERDEGPEQLATRDEVGPRGLPLDNARVWSGAVRASTRVAVVNGDPSPDLFRDEVYLLAAALRPQGRTFSGNDVTILEETDLETAALDAFDVLMLANVFRFSDAARAALERYVSSGGGLILFAGDQIDIEAYNALLYDDGRGLLPVRLIDERAAPTGSEDHAFRLAEWEPAHPVFRSFAGLGQALFGGVRIERFVASEMPARPAGETVDATHARGAGAAAPSVLARLDDSDGSPLVVEKAYGDGKVIFVATTADGDWTNWCREPAYVPFILELTAHAARPPDAPGSTRVGDPIELTIDANAYAPRVSVFPPFGDATASPSLDARPAGDETLSVVWTNTPRSGVYRLELYPTSGAHETRYAAVNPDSMESDLRPAGVAALERAFADVPFDYVRGSAADYSDAASESRRELWWPLLLVTLGVLMLEHTLAWRFGTRGGFAE